MDKHTESATMPDGFACEVTALTRLHRDVDSLPLHAYKRKIVRDWIAAEIDRVTAEAVAAKVSAALAKAQGGEA